VTLGAKGNFTYWRIDPVTGDLQFSEVDLPMQLQGCEFVSACFTPHLPLPIDKYLLVLGTKDGAIVLYDPSGFDFYDGGQKHFVTDNQIGSIEVKNGYVALACSNGKMIRYKITAECGLLPPKDKS